MKFIATIQREDLVESAGALWVESRFFDGHTRLNDVMDWALLITQNNSRTKITISVDEDA